MNDIRVLVVDEDPDVLDLTETFLERADDDLDVATEEEPLAVPDRVAAEDVDCVVSDLRMPDLDGFELQERLAEEDEEVPFILFTAADDEATRQASEEAGVDNLILKGTGTDHYTELARQIRNAVEAESA
jgi:DNA-binding NarL/FixJ family response regulator